MTFLNDLLLITSAAAALVWAGLSLYVLAIHRRRVAADRVLASAFTVLDRDEVRGLPVAERVARVHPVVAHASRELMMRAAADPGAADDTFAVLAATLADRWGFESLVRDAAAHRSARDKWRRTTAIRILARLEHDAALDLLERAVTETDADVADAALTLLGASTHPRAIDILVGALRKQQHAPSQIAMQLDRSPQWLGDRLRGLLRDSDPVVRLWGATLLARYPQEPIEADLADMTNDADPRVRKAAIHTLGKVGDQLAGECALRLLQDPVPYVRAHAARALGEMVRIDMAEAVAALLGDADFWVRLAARESLEMMGGDIWPVLMRCLTHEDRFVQNGAAEVFQNLGVLDSLIVMEAATDHPGAAKIALLKKITAAGGVRFTESLVARAGPALGARIRHLLATIGLERVQAA